MAALLSLGFVAGAVVGYGVRVDPERQTLVDGLPGAAATQGELSCGPTEEPTRLVQSPEAVEALTESLRPESDAAPSPAETPSATRTATQPVSPMPNQSTAQPTSQPTTQAVTPPLTQPLTPPVVSPTLDAAPATGRYAVQLGVFGVETNADRFATSLRGRGYDPLVVAARNRSGQWMKRVHLAVFDTEASALAAAESFNLREGLPAVVVTFEEGER